MMTMAGESDVSLTTRGSLNRLSALVAIVFLVIGGGVQFTGSSFTARINDISANLDNALYHMLDGLTVNYTELSPTTTTNDGVTMLTDDRRSVYWSDTRFNARGMAPLLNITNKFMDFLLTKDFYPKDLLVANTQLDGTTGNPLRDYTLGALDAESLLYRYAGVLAVVLSLALFGLLMPLCGFCFCCCRCCCGYCGGRTQQFDKRHDCCRKFLFASVLLAFGTMMLFGVVCAFVSNQHIQDGTEEFTTNVRRSIKDTDTYLNNTEREINVLLKTNYKEFEVVIFSTLDKSSAILYDQLAHYSNAVAMSEVSNIVDGLGDIQRNLTTLKYSTNGLRVNASQLNDAMRKVKKDLLSTLHNCQALPECKALSNDYISKLGTEIDFNSFLDRYFPKLPDISTEMAGLEEILQTNLLVEIQASQARLTGIKEQITRTVTTQLADVRATIRAAGAELDRAVTNVTRVLRTGARTLHESTAAPLSWTDRMLGEYGQYRNYIGLAVSSALLTITVCIALGLLCGICGKRPDAYSADCCNKGAGSKFLILAVALMFLLSLILAAVVIIHFLVGVFAQRLICDTPRHPESSEALRFLSSYLNRANNNNPHNNAKNNPHSNAYNNPHHHNAYNSPYSNPHNNNNNNNPHSNAFNNANNQYPIDLAQIITGCHRNESVYKVLGLSAHYNVTEVHNYAKKYDIDGALASLQREIDRITIDGNILSEEAQRSLNELAVSGISDIKFYKFTEVLDHNLTSVNLTILSEELRHLIYSIESTHPELVDVLAGLKNSALHIETYQLKLVDPMVTNATAIIEMAYYMEEHLKFGKESFTVAIRDLIQEVQNAENYLKLNASSTLKKIAVDFTKAIEQQVNGYLDRVVYNIENKVGQCGPMSLVLNATLVSTCEKILYPFNGFWFGVLWCLILFVPTIIVSVKLSTLYQKYDPYPGSAIESEYLYDAYSDREQIPLASGKPVAAGKRRYKKSKRSERGGGGGGGGVAYRAEASGDHPPSNREYAASSQHHVPDARYADQANKNWDDFPNGGPPQYHRAPTEYERPPPYYFPGASDQN